MSAMRQTGPMKAVTVARMRAAAQHLDKTHPETTAAGHVRDAATVLASGRTDGAKRHLDAAMEVLTPRNLVRHGITDDAGHTTAKQAMHAVHRLRLQVQDIEDITTANEAEAERRRTAATEEREARARQQAIKTGAFPKPTVTDANGVHPPQSPAGKPGPDGKTPPVPGNLSQYRKQRPPTAGELAESQMQLSNIELSARTAMLERTPAPYGKPGGPGLYGVAGNKHSDYFEQIVQALMRKRGMTKEQASRIAWGAIKKWSRGGGHVHPEVRAAAGSALGQEKAAAARAHTHAISSWEQADRLIELAAGGPQWQSQTRVPKGQPGGGQFGASKGGGTAGKAGGHGSRAQRRAALVKKAVSIRMQIRQLESQLASLHHTAKSHSSKPAKKGAGAISAKAARAGKTATGKAAATSKARTAAHHTMSAATIHAKINALRAELAAVLRQIHQLSNDGDAIELSVASWLHELRGAHGRWTSDGGMQAKMIKPVKPPHPPRLGSLRAKIGREQHKIHSLDDYPATIAAVERPLSRVAGPHPLREDATFNRHGQPMAMAARALSAQRQAGTAPTPITQADLQKVIYAAVSEMKTAEYRMQATEDKKRRQKLAIHVGAVVGGAALTYAESKVGGIPELAQIMTAPGVLVGQELVDWARRL